MESLTFDKRWHICRFAAILYMIAVIASVLAGPKAVPVWALLAFIVLMLGCELWAIYYRKREA